MSNVVTLLLDSKPISVFCHMGDFGCGVGGWTPVIKIDGNKVWLLIHLKTEVIFEMYFSHFISPIQMFPRITNELGDISLVKKAPY